MLCSETDKSLEVNSIYVHIYVEHFPVAIEDTELERGNTAPAHRTSDSQQERV